MKFLCPGLLLLSFSLWISVAVATEVPLNACDRSAAADYDINRVGPSTDWDLMNGANALKACREALARYGRIPRLRFQYARALHKLKRTTEALEIYQELATVRYQAAEYNAAIIMIENPIDRSKGLTLLQKIAAQKFLPAQSWYGRIVLYGHYGVVKDERGGIDLLRKSARKGYRLSQYVLGLAYHNGRGVPKNQVVAAKWARRAADNGSKHAQHLLGKLYNNGLGVHRSHWTAFEWIRKAANKNYAPAQRDLAIMYRDGQGVKKDPGKYIDWLRKASANGDAFSEALIGEAYANGLGVPLDYKKATIHSRNAARRGVTVGLYNLAISYFYGRGIERDRVKGYMYMRLAAVRKNQGATAALQNFARVMTRDQVARAEELSRKWKPTQ